MRNGRNGIIFLSEFNHITLEEKQTTHFSATLFIFSHIIQVVHIRLSQIEFFINDHICLFFNRKHIHIHRKPAAFFFLVDFEFLIFVKIYTKLFTHLKIFLNVNDCFLVGSGCLSTINTFVYMLIDRAVFFSTICCFFFFFAKIHRF